jgi:hypothetical protein
LGSLFSEEALGNRAVPLPVLLLQLLSTLLLRLLRVLLGGGESVEEGGAHPGGGLSSTFYF